VLGHFGSRVVSGQVSCHLVSGHFGFRVVSGRVTGHLVLGHFGFQVGSCIGSSNVGSFWILESYQVGSFGVGIFRFMGHIGSRRFSRIGSSSTAKPDP
jgi:hypothetical protein